GGEVALDVPDDRDPAADATSVIDLQTPPVAHDLAPVADLAAGLGIERVLPGLEREPPVRATDRDDVRLDLAPLVAAEPLLRRRLELVPPLGELVGRDLVPRGSPVPARPLALRLERGLVALRVDDVPSLPGHELGQVEREAEGVVQPERVLTRDHRRGLGPRLDR